MFLAAGLVIGGLLGLLASRTIKPPLAANSIAELPTEAKEEYVLLVAAAYGADRDLDQAYARLEQLEVPNARQWIAHMVDDHLAEAPDTPDTRALIELAHGLGINSPAVLGFVTTLTPVATDTPRPTPPQPATPTPSPTPLPPTEVSNTALPTPVVSSEATATPRPQASDTAQPTNTATAAPRPTNTPRPEPSNTAKPTKTSQATWSWTARLIGPGQEGQSCAEGHKLIRVTVLDAAGSQIPRVWVHEKYTGWYRLTGHKGDDPYWGPGEVELSNLDGGQVCIASGEGGPCESELTRNLPCHDPPPFEDLWAAGYCECCEPGISKEKCRELFEAGRCLGISHYAWRVSFQRSW